MTEDHADCKSVRRVLDTLGYTEVRRMGADEWKPLKDVDGRYGTTDQTHVFLPEPGRPHVALRDAMSGEPVGWARKPASDGEGAMRS